MLRKFFLLFSVSFMFSSSVWAQTIHDVRPPVKYPLNVWVIILLILVLLLLVGIVFYYLRNSRKKRLVTPPMVQPKAPWEIALERLTQLNEKKLIEKGLVDAYFTEVSEIVRYYCEGRFSVKAPEMTTEEFLRQLRTSGQLNENQKDRLKGFLTQCDLVKFAKYAPTRSEAGEIYTAAKDFIIETKGADSSRGAADGL